MNSFSTNTRFYTSIEDFKWYIFCNPRHHLVIKNYNLLHFPSPCRVTIHIPSSLHYLQSETIIELMDEWSIMIGEHDFTASLIENPKSFSKLYLHISTKIILVIAREIRCLRKDIVWGIKVDEISLFSFIENMLETLHLYISFSFL